MIRFKKFLIIGVIPFLLALPIAVVSSCASAPKNAYKASGVTHVTARTALRAWDEYLKQQYASVTNLAATNPDKATKRRAELVKQSNEVQAAYEKYQAAQRTLLVSAKEFSRIPATNTNAPPAADRLTVAVSAASVSLASLIELLQSFGVTVK